MFGSVLWGFDFRFSLKVMPPPDMFVDLGNYLFISVQKGSNEAAWLLISQSLRQTHMPVSYTHLTLPTILLV